MFGTGLGIWAPEVAFLELRSREVGGRETGFNHVAYVRLWPLASSILFRCDFNHEVTLDPQKDRVPDAVKPISSETFGRSMVNLAPRCSGSVHFMLSESSSHHASEPNPTQKPSHRTAHGIFSGMEDVREL